MDVSAGFIDQRGRYPYEGMEFKIKVRLCRR